MSWATSTGVVSNTFVYETTGDNMRKVLSVRADAGVVYIRRGGTESAMGIAGTIPSTWQDDDVVLVSINSNGGINYEFHRGGVLQGWAGDSATENYNLDSIVSSELIPVVSCYYFGDGRKVKILSQRELDSLGILPPRQNIFY